MSITYRIYTIGRDGLFKNIEVVECADDREAVDRAIRAADGFDVEIWDYKRFVARLPGIPKKDQAVMLVYLTKRPHAFDPETVALLCATFDTAWGTIQASGARFNILEGAHNELAKHIVALALPGERNRRRLIDGALARLRL